MMNKQILLVQRPKGIVSEEHFELKEVTLSSLLDGELIIKNPTAIALGMGKKFKKIKVSHLI